ncbi:FKBP-type peptidyl-prolyl cis-trans isomerase [Hydrocarboniclastica marina]|uniref:Peptidyl-prolyl cis-trans isomerase n=1 Tax=Hydrocarboniclastica marina TaxID=2259620 RepID=A0A4P7XEA8_9ALTE|nr:peptidylprolyl isomerase [Hydrocarboniclastica marina]QCF25259.1 peptidylprolyl isomerase [Hydrocarboniclastica marina]
MQRPLAYVVHYRLKNHEGEVIDSSEGGEPLRFVAGSRQVIAGIEKAVEGRGPGDLLEVTIPPDLAYGEHDPALVNTVPASVFEGVDQLQPGMKFQTNTGEQTQVVKVIEVAGDTVVVDANHPLAGLTLYFDLEIIETRSASDDELQPNV